MHRRCRVDCGPTAEGKGNTQAHAAVQAWCIGQVHGLVVEEVLSARQLHVELDARKQTRTANQQCMHSPHKHPPRQSVTHALHVVHLATDHVCGDLAFTTAITIAG